ncbi:ricin-type beta-trefoil lectin domain protein [Herbihabitans rhizosphaerae]|uniref:ricin-type beta-trefoil lectin domain protein n=1 Tax=Herbihabitans rhizosphaerae TaxID=1872711 RepID=UPI00102CD8DF|nr:ricin-type beta-trefoil lectin domain protein [Herbihabitans rhizosphaerae]
MNGGTAQVLAIGNSVRGPVTGLGGNCMDAEGGVADGVRAILYACGGGLNQAWIAAADGTLRLPSDHCLAVDQDGSVKVPGSRHAERPCGTN